MKQSQQISNDLLSVRSGQFRTNDNKKKPQKANSISSLTPVQDPSLPPELQKLHLKYKSMKALEKKIVTENQTLSAKNKGNVRTRQILGKYEDMQQQDMIIETFLELIGPNPNLLNELKAELDRGPRKFGTAIAKNRVPSREELKFDLSAIQDKINDLEHRYQIKHDEFYPPKPQSKDACIMTDPIFDDEDLDDIQTVISNTNNNQETSGQAFTKKIDEYKRRQQNMELEFEKKKQDVQNLKNLLDSKSKKMVTVGDLQTDYIDLNKIVKREKDTLKDIKQKNIDIKSKIDIYKNNIDGGNKKQLEKERKALQRVEEIKSENIELMNNLKKADKEVITIKDEESNYQQYYDLILNAKNTLGEKQNIKTSYQEQIENTRKSIQDKDTYLQTINESHLEKQDVNKGIEKKHLEKLDVVMSNANITNMNLKDNVLLLKELRLREIALSHDVEAAQEKIDNINQECIAIKLLSRNPEISNKNTQKKALDELKVTYSKKLNQTILKNTSLRTNIVNLDDEAKMLKQRNENIENDSGIQRSNINSDIESEYANSVMGQNVQASWQNSNISETMPFDMKYCKYKNNREL